MKKLIKKILFYFLLAAIAIGAAAAIYYYQLPQASYVVIGKGSLSETIEETGYIRSAESYDIQAPSAGRVVRLDVANGQEVKAGQPIAVVQNIASETQFAENTENIRAATADRDRAQAVLTAAKNDMEEARKELDTSATLYKAGAISRIEYESVENNLRKAKDAIPSLAAALQAADFRLAALQSQQQGLSTQVQQLTIVSPIHARILALPVKKGQVVPAGAVLAVAGAQGSYDAYAEILSDEVTRIHPGQPVDILFGTEADSPIPGHVKEIYPQAVEKPSPLGVLQRRVPILISLDENGPLKPGYEVSVRFRIADRRNVLLAPKESIATDKDDTEIVKALHPKYADIYTITVKKIRTGLKNPFDAEIVQGLKEGEMLLRDGSLPLQNGAWIRLAAEQ